MAAPKPALSPNRTLPIALRVGIAEASALLRMSRAQLYNRIGDGTIKVHKDGARTYITRAELDRYVEACSESRGLASMAVPQNLNTRLARTLFRTDSVRARRRS